MSPAVAILGKMGLLGSGRIFHIKPSYCNLRHPSVAPPPYVWFVVSAIFHYLGPAFTVLLFPAVGVLGVAWLRIASATIIGADILAQIAAPRDLVGIALVMLGVSTHRPVDA